MMVDNRVDKNSLFKSGCSEMLWLSEGFI